jgi:2-methylcitrate dehydratase PrpD
MRSPKISRPTRLLSEYMATALRRRLPAPVVEKAKHHILDTLAAMVSGSRLAPGKGALKYVATLGGTREACVVGSSLVTNTPNAALANGISAHADETDDSHAAAFVHPGAAIVPAALAAAEKTGADGQRFLRAVTLGYDVGCRLTRALDVKAFSRASRSTHGFGGTFGAGAAAGALFGLKAPSMRHLLSYLAQSAAGCRAQTRDPGHMEKGYDFAGRSAHLGVLTAGMVASGFTGVDDVFSGRNNFFEAFSSDPHPDALIHGLGKRFEIVETAIKKWSVGSSIQAPLDSLSYLLETHDLSANDIVSVDVHLTPGSAKTVDNADLADINVHHLVALMIADGGVTFASCHDWRRVRDPQVTAIRKRVRLIPDASLPDSRDSRQAIVAIVTRDGRRLVRRTDAVRGTPANPASRAEVTAKARDLMGKILGARRTGRLIDIVMSIDNIDDVKQLRPLLRPPTP